MESSERQVRGKMTRFFDVVVAADLNGGIGNKGSLPWPRLKGEMAYFRKLTLCQLQKNTYAPDPEVPKIKRVPAVIMGRKTFYSLPVPLSGRFNLVVTSDPWIGGEPTVESVFSLDQALLRAEGLNALRSFVIGGAKLYQAAFTHPGCRDIYLTKVRGAWTADVHLPTLPPTHTAGGPTVLAQGVDEGIEWQVTRWRRS